MPSLYICFSWAFPFVGAGCCCKSPVACFIVLLLWKKTSKHVPTWSCLRLAIWCALHTLLSTGMGGCATSTNVAMAFHKILLGTSVGTMLVLAYMQPKLILGCREPLDADFSFQWTLCYCLACGLSFWTILVHPKATPESMKWSIPANAIFWEGCIQARGSALVLCLVWCVCVSDDSSSLLSTIFQQVINLFLAIASFQALMEELGLERYYRTDINGGVVTPIVCFSFTIGAAYVVIHSILVLRIQTFLTVLQLRSVCLYKLLVNLLLPQQNSKSWCSILFWSHI